MAIRHKGLMIILDGLGDRPSDALDGLTPLEAAPTPNLDRLVEAGMCGLACPLMPGVPVGTHTGTSLLLGLAPGDAKRLQRGPVQAAGIGLVPKPGDILMRCNFATLASEDSGVKILDRRAGRISQHTDRLAAALEDLDLPHGIKASLSPATQHRAVLRLTGGDLSAEISNTDPGSHQIELGLLESRPFDPENRAATATAEALNAFTLGALDHLRDHAVNRERVARGLPPANGIICQSPGQISSLRSIVTLLGLKAATVAGESTVTGLGKLLNFTTITDPSFTALADTNLQGKIAAVQSALADHDLVFLHIKGTDICAHDQEPECKRDFIARIDAALSAVFSEELVIGVTGDHSTDSNSGRHTGDPVPSLLYARCGRRDGRHTFGEADCMQGGLGHLSATGFLTQMLDNMGAVSNFKPEYSDYLF